MQTATKPTTLQSLSLAFPDKRGAHYTDALHSCKPYFIFNEFIIFRGKKGAKTVQQQPTIRIDNCGGPQKKNKTKSGINAALIYYYYFERENNLQPHNTGPERP